LGTNFFFGRSLFSAGCCFGVRIFLGPIGQEAKAVIISGLAVTAGQFLVHSEEIMRKFDKNLT